MKRMLATGIAVMVAFGGGMAVRAASGTPEVAGANATMQLSGQLKATKCPGEDPTAAGYETYAGTLKGGEADFGPAGDPGYGLTGTLIISGIHWTIDLNTARGVLTGTVTLKTSAGAVVYTGKITLISQGVPKAGAAVPSRGWIVAKFTAPDEGVTPGDDNLLANVELSLSPNAANGQFGDLPGSGTLGFKDFSAVTNVAPTALDGTC